jgi:hypothetical protein
VKWVEVDWTVLLVVRTSVRVEVSVTRFVEVLMLLTVTTLVTVLEILLVEVRVAKSMFVLVDTVLVTLVVALDVAVVVPKTFDDVVSVLMD